ncbi:MAG: 50S ribosomal protein L4 [Alphaproteobacteria bacterium]|nr:50S ribosomal protein L4 [Alphaproteobacteria bacterium]
MKLNVVTLENKAAGDLEVSDKIFGLEVRKDILARVIQWQRDKARAGTHKTKTRSEVSGTGKKPFKQKGTGQARQGTLRGPHQEGGGRAHGPVVRDHGYDLQKKVRKLGLRHALSAKQAEGKLFIVDSLDVKKAKTKDVAANFKKIGLTKPLIIGGEKLNEEFAKAARNLVGVDVLPTQGANVLDIMRHKELVLTKEAAIALEKRLA